MGRTDRPHHDCVVEAMKDMPRGRVLDVPAGEGELTVRLRAMGFDVEACDIDPARWKASGPPPKPGNMNDRLPFDNGSFDYVVCVKGLHRIYGVGRAVSEFARVLRPGGHLIVVTPNYSHISRRLKFLFLGSISASLNEQHCKQTSDAPEANFRNMLLLPQLCLAIENAGMKIVAQTTSRGSWGRLKTAFLFAPASLLVRLGALAMVRRKSASFRTDRTNDWNALIGGPHVVLVACKPAHLESAAGP
ncbi:MAG: class I SAM-dependent methyltransferase [Planctomycetota bacterium]|nr:class I SAM-dependent methyltransferase [Planctomycetota bacterium]